MGANDNVLLHSQKITCSSLVIDWLNTLLCFYLMWKTMKKSLFKGKTTNPTNQQYPLLKSNVSVLKSHGLYHTLLGKPSSQGSFQLPGILCDKVVLKKNVVNWGKGKSKNLFSRVFICQEKESVLLRFVQDLIFFARHVLRENIKYKSHNSIAKWTWKVIKKLIFLYLYFLFLTTEWSFLDNWMEPKSVSVSSLLALRFMWLWSSQAHLIQ